MKYDCFYFFDEFDLLEIRLNVLDSVVDKFVLIESTETFNGKQKSLVFQQNRDKFKKWEDKIIYHCVDDFPNDSDILRKSFLSPNTGNKEHWWIREFYQKESLIKPLSNICFDDDIVFISDVDEIWNPEIEIKMDDFVHRPKQIAYPFYLNNRSNQDFNAWTGTRYGKFKTLKKYGPNHFRTEREVSGIIQENGGWHFSWLGKKSDKWNDNHPDNNLRFNMVSYTKMIKDESDIPKFIMDNKAKFVEKGIMIQ
jgi:beta-1,4-mannosyl-glycoprotein beta-1,4-N-acetylglucosaminyltransferase